MGKKTNIGWTGENGGTQNFWRGCDKVSEGCKFCYMYRWANQYGHEATSYIRAAKNTFNSPLTWKKSKMIFTCSLSDFFLEAADGDRNDAWEIIKNTPQHTWLILTKRPERIKDCLPDDWGNGYKNVWLGVTAENQKRLIERLRELSKVPARLKFVSVEPILAEMNLFAPEVEQYIEQIDWVIIGGESGNDTGKHRYRPSELNWYSSLVVQCKAKEIPVFVKQLGTHLAKKMGFKDRKGETLKLLPESLQVREFPIPKKWDNQLKFF